MVSDGAPTAVETLVANWRAGKRPAQAGISWSRQRWLDGLPDHAETLQALPPSLNRQAVREACLGAAVDSASAATAFVVVMVWGFGKVGYGPHRTSEILTGTPDAPERLLRAASTLASAGAVGAYRRLARDDDSRLRGLGPAFGTKYLYFCQPRPVATTALILDAFVADWLRCEVGVRLNPVGWSEPTYGRYLKHMHTWADASACEPDELESLIFQAEATKRDSQWAADR